MNSSNKLSLPSNLCTQSGVPNDLIVEANVNFPVGLTAGCSKSKGVAEAYGCGIMRVGIIGKSRILTLPRIIRKVLQRR